MQRHATKPAPDVPKWSALLVEAVNKPGMIMEAYSAFHNYSIGNQILALVQCQLRGLEPGPINTFPGWQALRRTVKRGERALILCMPITRKVRDEEAQENNGENGERTFTSFMHKARWFAISQTVGDEFTAPRLPEWEAERALAALDIKSPVIAALPPPAGWKFIACAMPIAGGISMSLSTILSARGTENSM